MVRQMLVKSFPSYWAIVLLYGSSKSKASCNFIGWWQWGEFSRQGDKADVGPYHICTQVEAEVQTSFSRLKVEHYLYARRITSTCHLQRRNNNSRQLTNQCHITLWVPRVRFILLYFSLSFTTSVDSGGSSRREKIWFSRYVCETIDKRVTG